MTNVTICVTFLGYEAGRTYYLNNIPFEVIPRKGEVIEIEDLPDRGTLKIWVRYISHSFTKCKKSDKYNQLVIIHAAEHRREPVLEITLFWRKMLEKFTSKR